LNVGYNLRIVGNRRERLPEFVIRGLLGRCLLFWCSRKKKERGCPISYLLIKHRRKK
jgi:hypothetical protein